MTGRGRGRARGRGQGGEPTEPRPGVVTDSGVAPEPRPGAPIGRGRGRGGVPPPGVGGVVEGVAGVDIGGVSRPPAVNPPSATQPAVNPPPATQPAVNPPPATQPAGNPATLPSTTVDVSQDVRDKAGTSGSAIDMSGSYFRLSSVPNSEPLCQYNVSYRPDVESPRMRTQLLLESLNVVGETYEFDGMVLFLPLKLPDLVTKAVTRTAAGDPVQLTITLTAEVDTGSPMALSLYNTLCRRALRVLGMQKIGREYYNPDRKIDLNAHNLEAWPGASVSLSRHEQDTLLNVAVCHKVIRGQSALNFLYEIRGSVGSGQFYEIASKKLVGETVMTRYDNKLYEILAIDWEKHPTDTFQQQDGTQTTYKQYLSATFGKTVQDDIQPLLLVKEDRGEDDGPADQPLHVLPEFCFLTGLSEELRADVSAMKELAEQTLQSPAAMAAQLQNFMADLNNNVEAAGIMAAWGVQLEPTLHRFSARTLPIEKLAMRTTQFSYEPSKADWSRDMRGQKVVSAVNLTNWVLLHTSREAGIAVDFKSTMQQVCPPMGINVSDPVMVPLAADRTEAYLGELRDKVQANTQLVVAILPNNNKDRMDALLRYTWVEKPVAYEAVVSRTLSKKAEMMSEVTKIALRVNCKLGGELWVVDIPIKNVMVVGIDTYEDSATKGSRVVALVASTNQTCTRYYSRVSFYSTGQEINEQLGVSLTGALRRYREVNGMLPERVIVYRAGVADGQLSAVYEQEIPKLQATFPTVSRDYNPKFAVIVVKSNHDYRFFMEAQGHFHNPPPGSVIDTIVTRPEWYDFYLVSHAVRQGTVTPTHYNVVTDTSGLKMDHIQRLTYKLSHLYYNWPGTMRVPAPCEYARVLAVEVGQSVHQQPDAQLSDRLYYLRDEDTPTHDY